MMEPYISSEEIIDRLEKLREFMKKNNADICLITDNDPHLSEYTDDHYKTRQYFSGFTGSAGIFVISLEGTWLFTDGRYFEQARVQILNTEIELMKSGTYGVPEPTEFILDLAQNIYKKQDKRAVLITDGRCISASDGEKLEGSSFLILNTDIDIADEIWTDRPPLSCKEIYLLEEKYSGESTESKLSRIRAEMKKKGCNLHIISSLDDIAWILNLRGADIPNNPVFLSYLIVGSERADLFVKISALSEKSVKHLCASGVGINDYDTIYSPTVTSLLSEYADTGVEGNILLDKKRTNFKMLSVLKSLNNSNENIKFTFENDPSMLMKAVKNDTEIANLTEVHIDDGLCVTRLMYHIKRETSDDSGLTEYLAGEYVDKLRADIFDFKDLSFPTISAYGSNAAMMHYMADKEGSKSILTGGMLLVDSGGQYLRGTTDVTRTFAIGEVSAEEKKAFTLVLKGMLALADARFLKGCSGYNLDILARSPLWHEGLDYRCGTGHGVGYMLNVHEGPNAFRWRITPETSNISELLPCMVTTDEPGVYIDGKYGIRIENELLCEYDYENEYGTFLKFRTLTAVPIDLDLIDVKYLDEYDKKLLNEYHRWVFEVLSPNMCGDELEFLREYTRSI